MQLSGVEYGCSCGVADIYHANILLRQGDLVSLILKCYVYQRASMRILRFNFILTRLILAKIFSIGTIIKHDTQSSQESFADRIKYSGAR